MAILIYVTKYGVILQPPANSIIGIKSEGYVFDYQRSSVSSEAIDFKTNPDRIPDDEMLEQSINWEDDQTVREFTLNQRRIEGEIKFKGGIAILPKVNLERILNLPCFKDILDCERNELQDNSYHGNLLLKSSTDKRLKNQLRSTIATHIEEVIRQTNLTK